MRPNVLLNGSDLIVDEDQLTAFLADGSKPVLSGGLNRT